jgi:hypothetical protein
MFCVLHLSSTLQPLPEKPLSHMQVAPLQLPRLFPHRAFLFMAVHCMTPPLQVVRNVWHSVSALQVWLGMQLSVYWQLPLTQAAVLFAMAGHWLAAQHWVQHALHELPPQSVVPPGQLPAMQLPLEQTPGLSPTFGHWLLLQHFWQLPPPQSMLPAGQFPVVQVPAAEQTPGRSPVAGHWALLQHALQLLLPQSLVPGAQA